MCIKFITKERKEKYKEQQRNMYRGWWGRGGVATMEREGGRWRRRRGMERGWREDGERKEREGERKEREGGYVERWSRKVVLLVIVGISSWKFMSACRTGVVLWGREGRGVREAEIRDMSGRGREERKGKWESGERGIRTSLSQGTIQSGWK